ncbi:type II toxin-antitoxin system VapC family toxin [Halegenticoccus tardaugens]|uniref:type II toxin-antitoxin system VapC family toxin n=1 Tax=Halegenticoccus tardaugens TaxID=2071624 RepID=UPI00100A9F5E|nr:type II toxin-antitoxin system VapC family toxin [Halegenticoccus tardaugens]
MYCLDANIWVYYFDAELSEHEAISEPVTRLLSAEPLFTTTVLQMEVVHYLNNQLAESADAVERFLNLENTTVAALSPEDVRAAATLLDAYPNLGIGGRDASVVAAMERTDVSTLWTHDAGLKRLGRRLDWLTVHDPVESRSTPSSE